jgi:hypothetical protein
MGDEVDSQVGVLVENVKERVVAIEANSRLYQPAEISHQETRSHPYLINESAALPPAQSNPSLTT